jgi:DNA mismatch endonuclease, patch repair protein
MDTLTAAERSIRMSLVRGRNTEPELAVRRLVYAMGFRYRLHGRLPGRPDMVFRRLRKVIFVHGCFWHRHSGCKKSTTPAQHKEFWQAKFRANKRRDRRNYRLLESDGWRIIIVWECELRNLDALQVRMAKELGTE